MGALVGDGRSGPFYAQRFSATDIEAAHAAVEKGSLGKVIVDL